MPKNVIKEKEDFQRYILDYLKNKNGYVVRDAKTCFNSHYAMDIELLFQFLNDTQADTMEKLEKIYKDKTKETIINYLNKEITKLDTHTKTPSIRQTAEKEEVIKDALKHLPERDGWIFRQQWEKRPWGLRGRPRSTAVK